jgi:hypothetical protein
MIARHDFGGPRHVALMRDVHDRAVQPDARRLTRSIERCVVDARGADVLHRCARERRRESATAPSQSGDGRVAVREVHRRTFARRTFLFADESRADRSGNLLRQGNVGSRQARDPTQRWRARIDVVISGQAARGQTPVVPLSYGPNCQSIARASADLERAYPVGSVVAMFAPSSQSTNAWSNRVIAVEANRGGFVVKVPTDVERTPEGDLDFSRF